MKKLGAYKCAGCFLSVQLLGIGFHTFSGCDYNVYFLCVDNIDYVSQIAENHGETYLDKCRQYATNYMAFKKSAAKGLVTIPEFVEPPPVMNIPRHRWFMKVYLLDVISRLDYQLAELTSITGDILKIDSTKKITNKLAGNI